MMKTAYARVAASAIPGASLLPFVPGRGSEIPGAELTRDDVRVDPDHLAAYARVCGFALRDELPPTYPHVLAFPLHMALMADGRFPFGALGLVHIANRIVQHRPLSLTETLELRVRATAIEPHPRGRAFDIVSEVHAGGERAWESASTILKRGDGTGGKSERKEPEPPPPSAHWRLPGDLGRRYAAVSADRNPIHLHPLTARLFGFPGAIAHGMWTKARCLAALQGRLPSALEVEVRFRRPIVLPATVTFGSDGGRFTVRGERDGEPHLDGRFS